MWRDELGEKLSLEGTKVSTNVINDRVPRRCSTEELNFPGLYFLIIKSPTSETMILHNPSVFDSILDYVPGPGLLSSSFD